MREGERQGGEVDERDVVKIGRGGRWERKSCCGEKGKDLVRATDTNQRGRSL